MSEDSQKTDLQETPSSEGDKVLAPKPEAFHILVVDDEEDVREVLCDLIKSEGYRVTGAPGGQEALRVLEETSVDLVLTDLMMPEMSGWQLTSAIQEKHSGTMVVVVTGFISEQGGEMLSSRDVDGYLSKPVDHRRLQVLLRALLFARNLGRPAEVVAVDDDADVLAAIDHVLSKRGIYVTAFEELDQALQHIRKNPPDLAIIDLLFPGASGFGLCEAIRSDPSISQMPLLILTAHSSQENIKKAVGLHINGFVAKPFDTEEFGERVLKMLRQTGKTIGG